MSLKFAAKLARLPVQPVGNGLVLPAEAALLAANESPFPPLPEVVAAAAEALRGANRYPDPTSARLRSALAERHDWPASMIAIGNGSCDLLLAAGEALLDPGAELVHAWPSFSIYPHLAAAAGARTIRVPLDGAHRHDLEAIARAITPVTRLVIVCNPNNPTGAAVPVEHLAAFVADVPRSVCVVLDEAYIEFNALQNSAASVDLLARHPNLALLRTFSKAYSLAGLRVGYALCGSAELRVAIDRVRQPFFANAAAQAAALETLLHTDEIDRRVGQTIAQRRLVAEQLRALGLAAADSQANFCWLELPEGVDESEVVSGLAERGVLVRGGRGLGQPGALRVTLGLPDENCRFLDAIGRVRR